MIKTERDRVLAIENGKIVTPNEVIDGSVEIKGGRIVNIHRSETVSGIDNKIDAQNRVVMPGIIDLHGDDMERYLYPRDGARIETKKALITADNNNLASGITTKFHAVAFENEPKKNRSTSLANEILETVEKNESSVIDHRIHVRSEVTMPESVDTTLDVLNSDSVDIVSLMCHIPGKGQFNDIGDFKKWFLDYNDYTEKEVDELVKKRTSADKDLLNKRIDRIIKRAKNFDVCIASHDDESPVEIKKLNTKGVSISEYPITLEAAKCASKIGMKTAMGAPNLVRGGSQWGNLSTFNAIREEAVDILCSDYHPQSLLVSPFIDTNEPLPKRVRRVTETPAKIVGLSDRGRIEKGAKADIIIVEKQPTPRVFEAVIDGKHAYKAIPKGDRN